MGSLTITFALTVLLIGSVSSLECMACSGSMKPENCNIARCEPEVNQCYHMIPNTNQESSVRGCLPTEQDIASDCAKNDSCEFQSCSEERCNSSPGMLTSFFLIIFSTFFWCFWSVWDTNNIVEELEEVLLCLRNGLVI